MAEAKIKTAVCAHRYIASLAGFLIFMAGFGLIGSAIYSAGATPNPSLAGDINNDNAVTVTDLSILLSNYGTTNAAADINLDGSVNVVDLSMVLSHYGQTFSNYLFDEEFNGAANAPPDPSKWTPLGAVCDLGAYSCFKNSNIFQDGQGNLDLRIQREPSSYLGQGPFSGAFMTTYNYGSGWPPTGVKSTVPVPFRLVARIKNPSTPGAWPGIWMENTNYSRAQGVYELDISEERMTFPTTAICDTHYWVNGADVNSWGGQMSVSDMGQNWHIYSADVYTDHLTYYVDGVACGTSYGVTGSFGINIDNILGQPGGWGSGGQEPSPSDPGPWDMLIDYIKVTPL